MATSISEKGLTIAGDVNTLKEMVVQIEQLRKGEILEMSNKFTDLFFSIETTYQSHHGLDQDNWSVVH